MMSNRLQTRTLRLALGTASAALLAGGLFIVSNGGGSPARGENGAKASLNYQLTVQPETVRAKVGQKGSVKLVLKPTGSAHVDPRAPMALAVVTTGAERAVADRFHIPAVTNNGLSTALVRSLSSSRFHRLLSRRTR